VSPLPSPPYTLRPTFSRPLSLLSPLDHARLLYWALFHPQWLRDYARWCAPKPSELVFTEPDSSDVIRDDMHIAKQYLIAAFVVLVLPVLHRAWARRREFSLILQALILNVVSCVAVFTLAYLLELDSGSVDYLRGAGGTAAAAVIGIALFGGVIGWLVSQMGGFTDGVTVALLVGVPSGLLCGSILVGGPLFWVLSALAGSAGLGAVFSLLEEKIGVGSVVDNLGALTVILIPFGAIVGAVGGVVAVLQGYLAVDLKTAGVLGGIIGPTIGMAFGLTISRFPLYLLELLALVGWRRRGPHPAAQLDGATQWPFPGLRGVLVDALRVDLATGVAFCAEHTHYALQFIPVAQAVSQVMADDGGLQSHVWCRLLLRNGLKGVIQYGTVSLSNSLWNSFLSGLVVIPRRWRDRWFPIDVRLDSPEHIVCAAYWSVIEASRLPRSQEAAHLNEAIRCFSLASHLPHHFEVSHSFIAIRDCLACDDLGSIAALSSTMDWLRALPEPELRPEILYTLRQLLSVARDVETVLKATPESERSNALLQVNDSLWELGEYVSSNCLEPEKSLLVRVIERWSAKMAEAAPMEAWTWE